MDYVFLLLLDGKWILLSNQQLEAWKLELKTVSDDELCLFQAWSPCDCTCLLTYHSRCNVIWIVSFFVCLLEFTVRCLFSGHLDFGRNCLWMPKTSYLCVQHICLQNSKTERHWFDGPLPGLLTRILAKLTDMVDPILNQYLVLGGMLGSCIFPKEERVMFRRLVTVNGARLVLQIKLMMLTLLIYLTVTEPRTDKLIFVHEMNNGLKE